MNATAFAQKLRQNSILLTPHPSRPGYLIGKRGGQGCIVVLEPSTDVDRYTLWLHIADSFNLTP